MNALGAQYDWGVLAVDYDATPVPGVDSFLPQLFEELLEILSVTACVRKPSTKPALGPPGPAIFVHRRREKSRFEDVSASRLVKVLLDEFQAVRFQTICPLIQPERHIPHYRNEPERIFQQYLAARWIDLGEQAIVWGKANGQWFLFHLTPQRRSGPLLSRSRSAVRPRPVANAWPSWSPNWIGVPTISHIWRPSLSARMRL